MLGTCDALLASKQPGRRIRPGYFTPDGATHMHMTSTPDPTPESTSAERAAWWSDLAQNRSTVLIMAAFCTLALALPAAVSQRWSQHERCTTHARAQRDDTAWQWESPDNATFAICVIMKVPADDPQWVDGRPEDVHEVCKDTCTVTQARPYPAVVPRRVCLSTPARGP